MIPPARLALYIATGAGFALGIKSLVDAPPPLWIALAALLGYITFVTLGVIFSGFSMFADVVTRGPRDARGVALTFDDGPDPETTPQILELLAEAGATATFFVIGKKAEAHPELLVAMCEAGHGVGIHSYAHDRLFSLRSPKRIRADLQLAAKHVTAATGEEPLLFRAPIGHISPSMAAVVRELGWTSIGWSARGYDGIASADPRAVANRVMRDLSDGTIVLLHDAAERGDFTPASLEALPHVLQAIRDKRLPCVRVDSWLGHGDPHALEEAHEGKQVE